MFVMMVKLHNAFFLYSFNFFSLSPSISFSMIFASCTTANLQDELRKGNVNALNVMRLVRETFSDIEGVEVQPQVQDMCQFLMYQNTMLVQLIHRCVDFSDTCSDT